MVKKLKQLKVHCIQEESYKSRLTAVTVISALAFRGDTPALCAPMQYWCAEPEEDHE